MKIRNIATQARFLMFALVMLTMRAIAQNDHSSLATQQVQTPSQHGQPSGLLRIVRHSTERFKDVNVAEHEGVVRELRGAYS